MKYIKFENALGSTRSVSLTKFLEQSFEGIVPLFTKDLVYATSIEVTVNKSVFYFVPTLGMGRCGSVTTYIRVGPLIHYSILIARV